MNRSEKLFTSLINVKHYTFGLIKPSIFKQSFMVLNDILNSSIGDIIIVKKFSFTDNLAREFYSSLSHEVFFERLIANMTQGDCYGFVIKGEDDSIIDKYRDLLGATNPELAKDYTLRSKYGQNIDHNGTHGSDSINNAIRETQLIFPELFN